MDARSFFETAFDARHSQLFLPASQYSLTHPPTHRRQTARPIAARSAALGLDAGAILQAAVEQFTARRQDFVAELGERNKDGILQAGMAVCQAVGSLAAASVATSPQPHAQDGAVLNDADQAAVEQGLELVAQQAKMFGAMPAAMEPLAQLRPLEEVGEGPAQAQMMFYTAAAAGQLVATLPNIKAVAGTLTAPDAAAPRIRCPPSRSTLVSRATWWSRRARS